VDEAAHNYSRQHNDGMEDAHGGGRDQTTRAAHEFKRSSIVVAVRGAASAARTPFADRYRAQLAAIAGAPRA
jgi:hypothetical protein